VLRSDMVVWPRCAHSCSLLQVSYLDNSSLSSSSQDELETLLQNDSVRGRAIPILFFANKVCPVPCAGMPRSSEIYY
jgi:hypothetical protein